MSFNLSTFSFTRKSDLVEKSLLLVFNGRLVFTLDGNDQLDGVSSDLDAIGGRQVIGAYLDGGELRMEDGNDSLNGYASSGLAMQLVIGIGLTERFGFRGILDTGDSNDDVNGVASTTARSEAVIGILATGAATIRTGNGNDRITGKATGSCLPPNPSDASIRVVSGIRLRDRGSMDTGAGNDRVSGYGINTGIEGLVSGIFLTSDTIIETGVGNDAVSGRAVRQGVQANGFDGGGLIDLGPGHDRLEGFGFIRAKGGAGHDAWTLTGYASSDFVITKTNQDNTKYATLSLGGVIAEVEGFESFAFDDGKFSYAQLS